MGELKFRGRPPLLIAETVKDVIYSKDPYSQIIMDRSQEIDGIVGPIIGQSLMSWEGRNPRPALDQDGNFQNTDLDLLSFLVPLAARQAVIEIPQYQNRCPKTARAGERRIRDLRFGPIIRLVSNKKTFSFSVLILDMNVVRKNLRTGKEEAGVPKNYMMVDYDGCPYKGFDRIVWNPSPEEAQLISEKRLLTSDTIHFKYAVHPNRWQSVFSSTHILKKKLIIRIDDELGFYKEEIKRLKGLGIRLPRGIKSEYQSIPVGDKKAIKVKTMEMVLDMPEISGSYSCLPETPDGLLKAYRRKSYLTYVLRPLVQFCIRANELAYFLYGTGKVAWWMDGRSWKPGWKAPRNRVEWNQMVLSPDTALRYREKTVTQRVAAE